MVQNSPRPLQDYRFRYQGKSVIDSHPITFQIFLKRATPTGWADWTGADLRIAVSRPMRAAVRPIKLASRLVSCGVTNALQFGISQPQHKECRLFGFVIRIHNQPPTNRHLADPMLVMILRRQRLIFIYNDFPATSHAAIDSRVRYCRSRRMICIESLIINLAKIVQ
jgi:hypothetical protein